MLVNPWMCRIFCRVHEASLVRPAMIDMDFLKSPFFCWGKQLRHVVVAQYFVVWNSTGLFFSALYPVVLGSDFLARKKWQNMKKQILVWERILGKPPGFLFLPPWLLHGNASCCWLCVLLLRFVQLGEAPSGFTEGKWWKILTSPWKSWETQCLIIQGGPIAVINGVKLAPISRVITPVTYL